MANTSKITTIDGDLEWESAFLSPVCTYCKHLNDLVGRSCKAYPGGVPRAIWLGENNHKKPYPGDHGIQFEV